MVNHRNRGITVDTGMVVVIFISIMYIIMVIILLFYVKNDWCDLLFIALSESLRQTGLRQGWTVACTSVFTCCAVPQR
jgi:hypothetical protein